MKTIPLFFLSCIVSLSAFTQNVAINNDALPADASAILDVQSISKGILFPRMTAAEKTAIELPANGLVIYQIDGAAGLYYNYGTPALPDWIQLGRVSNVVAFSALLNPVTPQNFLAGQYIKVIFLAEDYDEQSNFTPASTSEFIAPSAGIYHFDAAVYIQGGNGYYISVHVNNTNKKLSYYPAAGPATLSLSADLKLITGDIVDIRVYTNNGGQIASFIGLPVNWFNGRKLN